jgi:hypothetical protein
MIDQLDLCRHSLALRKREREKSVCERERREKREKRERKR